MQICEPKWYDIIWYHNIDIVLIFFSGHYFITLFFCLLFLFYLQICLKEFWKKRKIYKIEIFEKMTSGVAIIRHLYLLRLAHALLFFSVVLPHNVGVREKVWINKNTMK